MIYKTVSIENLIGRVLRNTKLTDTSAIQSIYEWIPEAMEQLETKLVLEPMCKDLTIKFFQAKLPPLAHIEAVEFCGQRLRYSEQLQPSHQHTTNQQTVFQSTPYLWTNPATGDVTPRYTLEQVQQMPVSGTDYYFLKPNYLCTSMRDAHVTLHYRSVPCDENGFPLIPDNGNYKEALFWYVRGKLIGSGELTDPKNSEDSCTEKFEKYGGRAMNEITYPSIDKMESIRANHVRFGIAENYWSNFNQA